MDVAHTDTIIFGLVYGTSVQHELLRSRRCDPRISLSTTPADDEGGGSISPSRSILCCHTRSKKRQTVRYSSLRPCSSPPAYAYVDQPLGVVYFIECASGYRPSGSVRVANWGTQLMQAGDYKTAVTESPTATWSKLRPSLG